MKCEKKVKKYVCIFFTNSLHRQTCKQPLPLSGVFVYFIYNCHVFRINFYLTSFELFLLFVSFFFVPSTHSLSCAATKVNSCRLKSAVCIFTLVIAIILFAIATTAKMNFVCCIFFAIF